MKKFIDFVKKYKIHILSSLLFITFVRSCGKSRNISKLEKNKIELSNRLDSIVKAKDSIIDVKSAKWSSDIEYIDTWIKHQDRGYQLMELQVITDSLLKQSNKND
jgi:hypothetical protein